MRTVAVFNDTTPHRHFGSDAVMAALDANVTGRGARIVYRHPVSKPWRADSTALAAIDHADMVLVNGEGTIHHGTPAAAHLAGLGPHCAARDKPCFVINATIQANTDAIMRDLAAFDGLWVREERSAAEAKRWGIDTGICGDLSFFHSLPQYDGGRDRGLVLDSADPRTTAEMAKVAAALKADFVAMRHNKRGLKAYRKDLLRWRYETGKPTAIIPHIATFQDFGAFLARRRFLVTARFHGMCFAINGRVPFSAVPSNVWKSQAILSDIGLGSARLFRAGKRPKALTERERELISVYVVDVRERIAAMFDRILPGKGRRG